jgi:hypothetical protein
VQKLDGRWPGGEQLCGPVGGLRTAVVGQDAR